MSTFRFLSKSLPGIINASSLRFIGVSSVPAVFRIPQHHRDVVKRAPYTTTHGSANPEIVEILPPTDKEVDIGILTADASNNNGATLPEALGDGTSTDWSKSYYGLSSQPFTKEIAEILEKPIDPMDIEMKPGDRRS